MSNPFEVAIFALKRELGKAAIDDPCPICSYEAAIRVLEAAGKVDGSALETFVEMVCQPRDIWEEERVKEIRSLLSALPDEGGT